MKTLPKAHGVVHLLDPLDTYLLAPPLYSGEVDMEPYRDVSGLLAETSAAAMEYRSHPSVIALGWRIFHIPHHHTNLARRKIPCGRVRARTVGVHSTQLDPGLHEAIESRLSARFPDVAFRRESPGHLNAWIASRGLNPYSHRFTEDILEELLTFDVTIVKPNCYFQGEGEKRSLLPWRAWLCERQHSGQRLVNALSAGIPAVIWGASVAHGDVFACAQGVSAPTAAMGPHRFAWSNAQVVEQLSVLLESNGTRHCQASAEAQQLAEPYHLSRVVERYAIAFASLLQDIPGR